MEGATLLRAVLPLLAVQILLTERIGLSLTDVQVRVQLWRAEVEPCLRWPEDSTTSLKRIDDFIYAVTTTDPRGTYSLGVPIANINGMDELLLGILSGLAKHAQIGRGEPGVLLNFRKGLGVRDDGPVIGSVVSGADGSWIIVLEAGEYTMQGSKHLFATNYRNHPQDLDSHLTGPLPGSGERFRVFFGARGSKVTAPFSDLDVDDVNGCGPETITITQQAAGVYRFAVHHYYGEGLMSNSEATVTVTHAGGFRKLHIPQRVPGLVWTVFELNGSSIVPINTITNNQIQ
ncbi:hypothetical protein BV898_00205 [Hypsibius exemplaris]|uniref:Uncharacterized protein n=1 Tax=Hypsibius exemplaris TaxID=2072580 RepID=A0A1W0XF36_HYPEX|nr:hypothetical protein BV898_00205 [Hypsibius exemplaris]